MARTFSGDMPNASIGAGAASEGGVSLSWVALSLAPSDEGTTADAPQNRNPIATSAIGINHFTFGRRDAPEERTAAAEDSRGGGLVLCGAATGVGNAPGRRP